MILLAAIVGAIASLLLLAAGYLFGVRRGARARERLWQQSMELTEDLSRERRAQEAQKEELRSAILRQDFGQLLEMLLKQGETMQRMLEPLSRRVGEDENLRSTVEQMLTPLVERERLGLELSSVQTETGNRNDLTPLLDQIADRGQFRAVTLSDDEGLPLATSSNAWDPARLGGLSSHLLVLADRINREGVAAPLALMVHDEEQQVTLGRIFRVRGRRLLLMAVSTSTELTISALDPALVKIDAVLS